MPEAVRQDRLRVGFLAVIVRSCECMSHQKHMLLQDHETELFLRSIARHCRCLDGTP